MHPSARAFALTLCVSVTSHVAAEPLAPHRPAFPEPRTAPLPDRGQDVRIAKYRETQSTLELRRQTLLKRYARARTARQRDAVLDEAAGLMDRALVELVDPWLGTPWDFYGTSQEPGRGAIACGYFVTTLLRDASLKVERVKLAQQASERIVKTLAPVDRIWRFRTGVVQDVLAVVRAQPGRWFTVGLDLHTGLLLRLDDGRVLFCHASFLEPQAAICEDAATGPAMVSGYHVVGALFTPELMRKWVVGEQVATVK